MGTASSSSAPPPASYEALLTALRSGCVNLIDTATHYGGAHGDSERAVGQALKQLASEGYRARDSTVVLSKLGHISLKGKSWDEIA